MGSKDDDLWTATGALLLGAVGLAILAVLIMNIEQILISIVAGVMTAILIHIVSILVKKQKRKSDIQNLRGLLYDCRNRIMSGNFSQSGNGRLDEKFTVYRIYLKAMLSAIYQMYNSLSDEERTKILTYVERELIITETIMIDNKIHAWTEYAYTKFFDEFSQFKWLDFSSK